MSSQSSGEKPPDDSGRLTLSKTLNRPVLQMQNVGGVIPPAHSAQPLQSFLPAAAGLPQGLLAGNIDVNKPSLTANPINFSTLTPASTSSTSMMPSTQIVRVATPGTSQPSIVQISAPTSITSTSQHGTDGSILKPHIQTAYPSHLPRGAAAAASVLAAPKSNTAVPMLRPSQHAVPTSSSTTGIHGARGSLITTTPLRTTTPPLTRPISPAISVATTPSEPHRQMKALPGTTAMNTAPSIQITLQTANRPDLTQKQIITHQQPVQKPVHLSHGMALSSPKILMSQPSVTQHSVLSNISKTNKSTVPVSSIATFPASAVTLSNLTSAPISSINSLSAASSIIPVAKVNPVRQQQPSSISSSHLPSRPVTTTHDRTEPLTQSTAMFMPQPHRPITSTMTLPGSVTGVDTRQGAGMNLSQLQLQYMISPEYHQLMYQQMAAAAAAQATGLPISSASSVRPGLINQTPNLSATLQAAVHGLVSTTQPLVDHNTMLMRQGPLSCLLHILLVLLILHLLMEM
ncbi:SAP130 [Mytilus edulis]|uniref:SAP130 n=1 Tax=Mytilus edulis TaxID=6550 RepID=A0A8S3RPB0_MYTED|nr:SAP130 [Mytilus edulis]